MSLKKIRNGLFSLIGLVALLIAASGVMSTAAHACEVTISIDVSPNILNIQSKSTVLTVHTNINYHLVSAPTVSIYLGSDDPNPVAISWWKEDDRGNFVAKFSMSEIKAQRTVGVSKGIRVSGHVLPGSIRKSDSGTRVDFSVYEKANDESIPVSYIGLIPDTFKDSAEVVVEGTYDFENGTFSATTLLAKCPSKYEGMADEHPGDYPVVEKAAAQ